MVLFIRAILELLIGAAIDGAERRAAVADVQATGPCPNCGRVNSVHTRICPRCEMRLNTGAAAITTDRQDVGSVYERQDGEPLFMTLRDDDPELAAATAKAQETLPDFLAAFRAGRHSDKAYLVKSLFSGTVPDERAHIWVLLEGVRGANLICSPIEVPGGFTGLQKGVSVSLSRGQVEDWMLNVDGTVYGAYSLRVQRRRVPETEKCKFDAYVGITSFTDRRP
jgi:uncharacterized protein YegJ (DUF2314 family)